MPVQFLKLLLLLAAFVCRASGGEIAASPPPSLTGRGTNFIGLTTNGPAWFWAYTWEQTNVSPNLYFPKPGTPPPDTSRLPPSIARRVLEQQRYPYRTNIARLTNSVFFRFAPDSLHHLTWTNFIARTNGRQMSLWSTRAHPPGWPTNPPSVSWNHRGLLWGAQGLTALSPCWQQEGASGQVPITLLTKRHGYTRGHGMGADGFRTNFKGKKVWFLATNDVLVTATVAREVVRTPGGGRGDYTLVLFNRDLPDSVTPLRVLRPAAFRDRARFVDQAPWPAVYTEQGGTLGTMIPGLPRPGHKPGDSGSPNLLFLPGELVFMGGRTTASASPEMQEDMDQLCRLEDLNPDPYQMSWVSLSEFPSYSPTP